MENMVVLTRADRLRNNTKLTKEQVAEIRRLGPFLRQHEIAQRFGVSRVQVGNILARKQWADI